MTRPTAEQVSNDLNGLSLVVLDLAQSTERKLADAATSYAGLRKVTDDHRKGLQRHSSDHKVADRRLSDAEQMLGRLYKELNRLKTRIETLGEHAPQGILTATAEELKRLNAKADAYATSTQLEIDALRADFEQLSGRVEIVATATASAHDRLDTVETAPMLDIDPEKTTLDISSKVERHTPWGMALIIGIIVGVVLYIFMVNRIDTWSHPRSLGFSIVAGLAALCFAASFETFNVDIDGKLNWARRAKDQKVTKQLPAAIVDAPAPADDQQTTQQEVTA